MRRPPHDSGHRRQYPRCGFFDRFRTEEIDSITRSAFLQSSRAVMIVKYTRNASM